MAEDLRYNPERLRAGVRANYRALAVDPRTIDQFDTGRHLAAKLGYHAANVDALPDRAVESFAGVANPFSLRTLPIGERIVDVGSGAGLDSFVAAIQAGPAGHVIGVDMTPEMFARPGPRQRSSVTATSSSARDWQSRFQSKTDGRTRSSPTASSTCARTSGRCSARSAGSCGQAGPAVRRYRQRPARLTGGVARYRPVVRPPD